MSVTICNMLSAIRNACMVGKDFVDVKKSKISISVLKVMLEDGYILGYESINEDCPNKKIRIQLKYYDGRSVIRYIKAISTPRKPVYKDLPKIKSLTRGFSTFVISTSKGVMAHQEAIAYKVGGQIICEVGA